MNNRENRIAPIVEKFNVYQQNSKLYVVMEFNTQLLAFNSWDVGVIVEAATNTGDYLSGTGFVWNKGALGANSVVLELDTSGIDDGTYMHVDKYELNQFLLGSVISADSKSVMRETWSDTAKSQFEDRSRNIPVDSKLDNLPARYIDTQMATKVDAQDYISSADEYDMLRIIDFSLHQNSTAIKLTFTANQKIDPIDPWDCGESLADSEGNVIPGVIYTEGNQSTDTIIMVFDTTNYTGLVFLNTWEIAGTLYDEVQNDMGQFISVMLPDNVTSKMDDYYEGLVIPQGSLVVDMSAPDTDGDNGGLYPIITDTKSEQVDKTSVDSENPKAINFEFQQTENTIQEERSDTVKKHFKEAEWRIATAPEDKNFIPATTLPDNVTSNTETNESLNILDLFPLGKPFNGTAIRHQSIDEVAVKAIEIVPVVVATTATIDTLGDIFDGSTL
ncbi:hypothetical protein [Bathymodiolus thermophilus thioautotrophic gill symbiont]|uniref:Uncharacterized protein n=1 Tax=Bathymodiolus thermophilus thioautotrophic gill symbiont TaxID=2360 RepID=A0A1J5U4T8_9GAMM|nr:hypothetical protein [Bathymodiolus thermophilus thioautotrophic gill symbiont]OIR23806.1 hypothetical protein BGC33_08205 [Bathymodiolus thermophilus thioautotrophic gill symbiont]